ncbi:MAG: EAL domain-containing protein [Halothiobacillaceae bacterium]
MTEADRQAMAELRRRAEEALATGEVQLQEGGDLLADEQRLEARRVLEELRIYQAELEIQNQQLRESELQAQQHSARYEALFDSMPVAALVIDSSGVVEAANEAAAALMGFRGPRRLRQHSVFRLFDQDASLWLAETLTTARDRDSVQTQEVLRLGRDEDPVPVSVSLVSLPANYQIDRYYLLMLRDLRPEYERDRDRRLVQAILENSDALIYAFDEQGRCILANHKVAELMGRPVDALLGHHREEWLSEQEASRHQQNDLQVFSTGRGLIFEEIHEAPDGRRHHFLSHKFPLPDENGRAYAVGGITTDITEFRQTEIQLQLALQVFSRGSEGIVITDRDCRITSVNRAFERITGYQEQEVIGKNPRLLASGRHDAKFWESFWARVEKTGHWEGELWNRRRSGEVYPQWLSVSRVEGEGHLERHYIGVFSDITRRKMAEEEIEQLAFYDGLTGMPNRYLLRDRVRQAIGDARRHETGFSLLFIDLDRFKDINDVFGHEMGDRLLQAVSERISQLIRDNDTLSRIGGDEFVLLLNDIDRPQTEHKAKQLIEWVVAPYVIDETELNISASIGIAFYPTDGDDYDTLLKHADAAMYAAKALGRNTYSCFDMTMAERVQERVTYDRALRQSLRNGDFRVAYQPQVDLNTGEIIGVEALLRWNHPELGEVPPDTFIPVAEQSDLINELGYWVLEQSLGQLARWHKAGRPGLRMAVNVSARQFWQDGFDDQVFHVLERTGVPPHCLEIELTERLAMQDPEQFIAGMARLHKAGVRVAIDDFGTGYSSLVYLKKLPIRLLKIDRSFVRDIGRDHDDEIICRSILDLAQAMGLETVAEGVEEPAHAAFLRENGCRLGQGYLFARPGSAEETEALLQRDGLDLGLPASSPAP